ncbi:MAG: crossover junction endodeoxyribonuclease RuvC [Alphaproteobacteria bacterium]|nr:crossover junction endodeoxyribonuclease RuvC [Alphaproteobacteria bacterium]
MLILGIDPGLQKMGWGIISSDKNAIKFISCGLVKTNQSDNLALRLAHIHKQLVDVIKSYSPCEAAVEETFVNRNPSSALKLGQARGVALAVPALYGIEVSEYGANKIKKSVVGAGHADKKQVGMMIKTLLPTCGQISADEADALAVAICHAHYESYNKRILKACS